MELPGEKNLRNLTFFFYKNTQHSVLIDTKSNIKHSILCLKKCRGLRGALEGTAAKNKSNIIRFLCPAIMSFIRRLVS